MKLIIITILVLLGLTSSLKKTETDTVFNFIAHNSAFDSLKLKSGDPPASNATPSDAAPSGAAPSGAALSGAAPSGAAPAQSKYVKDLTGSTTELESWFFIKSYAFLTKKFPVMKNPKGQDIHMRFGKQQERLNEKFELESKKEGAPTDGDFWFRIKESLVYYTATKADMNILGSIVVKEVENIPGEIKTTNMLGKEVKRYCINLIDFSDDKYEICTTDETIKRDWLCSLQTYLKQTNIDEICIPEEKKKNRKNKSQTPTCD